MAVELLLPVGPFFLPVDSHLKNPEKKVKMNQAIYHHYDLTRQYISQLMQLITYTFLCYYATRLTTSVNQYE